MGVNKHQWGYKIVQSRMSGLRFNSGIDFKVFIQVFGLRFIGFTVHKLSLRAAVGFVVKHSELPKV